MRFAYPYIICSHMLLCLTCHNVYGTPGITVADVWANMHLNLEKNTYYFISKEINLEHPAPSSRKPHDFLFWYQADPDAKKSEAYPKPPTIGPGADGAPRDLHWKLGEIWHPCYLFKSVQMWASVKDCKVKYVMDIMPLDWHVLDEGWWVWLKCLYSSLDFMSIQWVQVHQIVSAYGPPMDFVKWLWKLWQVRFISKNIGCTGIHG